MAKKGRKDTGELYDVFRKITSEQQSQKFPLPPLAEGETQEAAAPEAQAGEPRAARADIGRAFVVSYNTAVITFVAFIIILVWVYLVGVRRGEKRAVREKSRIEAQNIKEGTRDALSSLDMVKEAGTRRDLWTVEVYRVPADKLDLLERNIRAPLARRKDVKETFIARDEDGTGYVLWVNRFPRGSTEGEICLEAMKNLEARSGGKAFKNPRIVPFDRSRVVK